MTHLKALCLAAYQAGRATEFLNVPENLTQSEAAALRYAYNCGRLASAREVKS